MPNQAQVDIQLEHGGNVAIVKVLNNCCSFGLSIHQRIMKKCITVSTNIF